MRERRFATQLPATFELGFTSAQGEIRDAGSCGVFVHATTIPDRGDKVWLAFRGPAGERVEAKGVVLWTTLDEQAGPRPESGFGVRLLMADASYRSVLESLARS